MWQLVYTAPEQFPFPEGSDVIPFPAPKLSAAAAAADLVRKPVSMTIVLDEGAARLEDDEEL